MKKKTILIVDDHELIRKGVRGAINGHFTICGEAENGQEAIEKTIALKPDLVVLDISMPVLNGLEAAREIRRVAPATKILLLSMHDSAQVEGELKAATVEFRVEARCGSPTFAND